MSALQRRLAPQLLMPIVHCSFKHSISFDIQTDFITVYTIIINKPMARTEAGTSSPGFDNVREIDEDEFYMLRGIVWM